MTTRRRRRSPSVYPVVSTREGGGAFLIATKNTTSYFWNSMEANPPTQLPPQKGPGLPAFPGGALEDTDSSVSWGAHREFFEETGVNLANYRLTFGTEWPFGSPNNIKYYAVYFQVSAVVLDQILQAATQNLRFAQDIAARISAGANFEDAYEGAYNASPSEISVVCPIDNELASIARWTFVANTTNINALNQSPVEWYYAIIQRLRTILVG